MKTYVARRLLALIPVALVVATVAFVLIHLAPGDPASVIAGPDASRDDVRRIGPTTRVVGASTRRSRPKRGIIRALSPEEARRAWTRRSC